MSTLQITHTAVVADEILVDVDPTVAQEEFFAFLGVDAATSANQTTGGSPATNVGAGPTYNEDHALCSIENTLRLPGAIQAGAYTIILSFQLVPGGSGAAARIVWCSPIAFITCTLTAAGLLTLAASGVTGPNATLQIAGSLDRVITIALVVGGGGTTRIRNLTDGTESEDGGTGGTVTSNAGVYLELVGGPTGSNTWQVRHYAAVKIAAALNDSAINAYYTFLRGMLDADRDVVT